MKFQVCETVYQPTKNGTPKVHKPGDLLPARVYNQLSENAQKKCKPFIQTRGPKSPWTREEYENLVELYLDGLRPDGTADHDRISTVHLEKFPTRSQSGAWMAIDQIRAHDAYVPQTGLKSASVALLGVLADTDPERFWVAVEVLLEKVA